MSDLTHYIANINQSIRWLKQLKRVAIARLNCDSLQKEFEAVDSSPSSIK